MGCCSRGTVQGAVAGRKGFPALLTRSEGQNETQADGLLEIALKHEGCCSSLNGTT